MSNFEPLLTKLSLPQIRHPMVQRSRLIDRLNQEVITNHLTLLVAQAGSGKTTLLAEWVSLPSAPQIIWLSLDKSDNDPARFWSNIIVAFSLKVAGLKTDFQQLLDLIQTTQISSQALPAETIVTELINTIVKKLPASSGEVCLVLDDYHLIENSLIHTSISTLLNFLPPNLHLLLATRSEPNLPLARLRARRQLLELRVADLRFTETEATGFYNDLMQLSLTKEQISAIEKRTEGWVAGMQLLALNLRSLAGDKLAEFVRSFEGTNRFIIDYLVQEVLENLPEAVQQFLLETSILERLNAELCEAVLLPTPEKSLETVQALLEKLTAENLFLTPLDEQGTWFRYHQLFAAMLQNRLNRTYSLSLRQELHRKAAQWLENHHWHEAAIRHYLLIEDYNAVAQLIINSLSEWWKKGELVNLYAWIEAVPEEVRQNYLELELVRAIPLILGSKIFELFQTLERVEHSLKSNPAKAAQPDIQKHFQVLKGAVAALKEDWVEAISCFKTSLTNFSPNSAARQVPPWYFVPMLNLAWAYRFAGQPGQAKILYDEAIIFCRDTQFYYSSFSAIAYRTELEEEAGHLVSAEKTYRATIKTAEEKLPTSSRYYLNSIYIGLARVLYQQNKLAEAQDCLKIVTSTENFDQNIPVLIQVWEVLALIALAEGDYARAWELLYQIQGVANFAGLNSLKLHSNALQADCELRQGKISPALQWAEDFLHANPDYVAKLPLHLRCITPLILNKVLIIAGKTDQALAGLAKLQAQVLANGQSAYTLEIYLLAALAYYPDSEAYEYLEKALAIAEPENYRRTFLDKGAALLKLFVTAPDTIRNHPFVQQLIKDFNRENNEPAKAEKESSIVSGKTLLQNHFDALSEREREVLHGLAEGLSNKALADKLIVSENTVKVHVRNIFAKLEVTSRTQALNRAKELGLL
jgi:LuxR family transcriptional regulator, maltose regulon positive regulatory protein